ncbi:putative RNA methyltransferase [Psychrobacter lutiphocae]|uniref:putative RNA methyltransferase n=1 Tax=Psychrobacter lutiphocae TaxID=540500 RepID=UPI00035F0780|nr:methyltransferase domain-containing protein [Psychrobacter lutiphocae]
MLTFVCPHCSSSLTPHAKTWQCDASLNAKGTHHPFDVARQGYVNLLPVQNKKSKDPGDSQESIEARHRFLSQDFYQPLQQLIAHLANGEPEASAQLNQQTWLDVGCGEGYYTEAIAQALMSPSPLSVNNLIALDISKPAVTQLAKVFKLHRALWYQIEEVKLNIKQMQAQGAMIDFLPSMPAIYPMVASASKLPLADNSLDAISSIFSPILPDEFARVLRVGGRLIIAKPDAGHLQSMREALFDEVRPHDSDKFLGELAPLFKLINTHQIQAPLSLDKQALSDLLTMTPYSYRAKAEKREALLASTERQYFETTARFVVYELVRL